MRKLTIAAALLGAASLWAMQDRPRLTRADQVRFVFFAVLEGLHHDGVDKDLAQAVLAESEPGLFVRKCPICEPVRAAFASYAPPKGPYMEMVAGDGLPKEAREALKSKDRAARLKGLASAIDRWVQRRFELVKLGEADRSELQRLLKEGMKQGMQAKPGDFGDYCPSCDGANGIMH